MAPQALGLGGFLAEMKREQADDGVAAAMCESTQYGPDAEKPAFNCMPHPDLFR